VAERLHYSPSSVRAKIYSGQLGAVQLGGRGAALRVPADALERFVYGPPKLGGNDR
jgi:hypothetical protein